MSAIFHVTKLAMEPGMLIHHHFTYYVRCPCILRRFACASATDYDWIVRFDRPELGIISI